MQQEGSMTEATTRGTKLSILSMIAAGDSKQFVGGTLRPEAPAAVVRGFTSLDGREVTAISIPSPEAIVVPAHTGARTVRTFVVMDRATARVLQKTRAIGPSLARAARPLLARAIARSSAGPEGEARQLGFDVL